MRKHQGEMRVLCRVKEKKEKLIVIKNNSILSYSWILKVPILVKKLQIYKICRI